MTKEAHKRHLQGIYVGWRYNHIICIFYLQVLNGVTLVFNFLLHITTATVKPNYR